MMDEEQHGTGRTLKHYLICVGNFEIPPSSVVHPSEVEQERKLCVANDGDGGGGGSGSVGHTFSHSSVRTTSTARQVQNQMDGWEIIIWRFLLRRLKDEVGRQPTE